MIAIERRHGIGDRLSAVVVLQNVLDIGQCRKAAEGRIAEFQLIAITQFKCGNIPDLNIAIVGVLILHGSDVCTCAVQQSKLRIVCSVLFEVEAQGRLGVQDQAVAVICDPLVSQQRTDAVLFRNSTGDAVDLVIVQAAERIADTCICQGVGVVFKLRLRVRAVVEHGFDKRDQLVGILAVLICEDIVGIIPDLTAHGLDRSGAFSDRDARRDGVIHFSGADIAGRLVQTGNALSCFGCAVAVKGNGVGLAVPCKVDAHALRKCFVGKVKVEVHADVAAQAQAVAGEYSFTRRQGLACERTVVGAVGRAVDVAVFVPECLG